jgi:hypothetical protein
MLQIPIDLVMNCVTTEQGWNNNPFALAIFRFGSPGLVKVRHQITSKTTDRFFHPRKSFCQKPGDFVDGESS